MACCGLFGGRDQWRHQMLTPEPCRQQKKTVINIQSQSNYWQKVELFIPGAKEKITSSLLIPFPAL